MIKEELPVSQKYALVFLTKHNKTSLIPEDLFEKAYKKNGKEIPLYEGSERVAVILKKQYECKILRLCTNKKYLESLIVTKEGNLLLHGTITPSKENLARRLKLIDDDTDEQKVEKRALHYLNKTAEEQPPSTRLDGSPNCNHGCSNCCSMKLPVFPSLPDGFVKTLVSLSEYFSHFHKSTAANILATGAALSNLANHLSQPWQWPSEKKVELRKGAGVWIDAAVLRQLVKLAEFGANRKPPHQALVKSLLTHLIGMENYIETSAEKMDRRLLSAVVAFTNQKYPEISQPVERFYRCINLNRGYLIKKRNEGISNQADKDSRKELKMQKRLSSVEFDNLLIDSNPKKAKVSVGSSNEKLQASFSSIGNSERSLSASAMNDMTNKKIIVVQRGTPGNVTNLQPNSKQIFSSVLNTVPKIVPSSIPQPYIIQNSSRVATPQQFIMKTSVSNAAPQPVIIRTSSASSSSQPYIIQPNATSSSSQPYIIQPNATSSTSQQYIFKTNSTSSNSPFVIKTNAGSSNLQPAVIAGQTSLQSVLKSSSIQSLNSSSTPHRVVMSSLTSKPTKFANLQNTPPLGTDSNPIVLTDLPSSSKSFVGARPVSVVRSVSSVPTPMSQSITRPLNTSNVNSQSLVTSMSQLGMFRFAAPTTQVNNKPQVDTSLPLEVKIEKRCVIEGALDLEF